MTRTHLPSPPQPADLPLARTRPAPVRFQRGRPQRQADKPFVFTDFASI